MPQCESFKAVKSEIFSQHEQEYRRNVMIALVILEMGVLAHDRSDNICELLALA
jgi:hypothetical protein